MSIGKPIDSYLVSRSIGKPIDSYFEKYNNFDSRIEYDSILSRDFQDCLKYEKWDRALHILNNSKRMIRLDLGITDDNDTINVNYLHYLLVKMQTRTGRDESIKILSIIFIICDNYDLNYIKNGYNALFLAAKVRPLLDGRCVLKTLFHTGKQIDINMVNSMGCSLLLFACIEYYKDSYFYNNILAIIDKGANILAVFQGFNVLHCAIKQKKLDLSKLVIKKLLETSPDNVGMYLNSSWEGVTPLTILARSGTFNEDFISFMTEEGLIHLLSPPPPPLPLPPPPSPALVSATTSEEPPTGPGVEVVGNDSCGPWGCTPKRSRIWPFSGGKTRYRKRRSTKRHRRRRYTRRNR
jgi:hypothetical protein